MADERDYEGLATLVRECWEHGEAKGWHSDEAYAKALDEAEGALRLDELPEGVARFFRLARERARLANGVNVGEQLMLIVTETAEAMEAYRRPENDPTKSYTRFPGNETWYPYVPGDPEHELGKPEGVGSELADGIIRQLHLASRMGIDIAGEIRRKMKYNQRRSHRHGGKRA